MRIAILAAGAALMALGACTSAPAPAPAPPPAAPPLTPPPVRPAPVRDSCGAAALQHLVGQPRTEVPVPVDPGRQRVACTTCAVTQDYRADRLNFFFDATSGRITEIRCG